MGFALEAVGLAHAARALEVGVALEACMKEPVVVALLTSSCKYNLDPANMCEYGAC